MTHNPLDLGKPIDAVASDRAPAEALISTVQASVPSHPTISHRETAPAVLVLDQSQHTQTTGMSSTHGSDVSATPTLLPDGQASSIDHPAHIEKTGPELANLAKKELGINTSHDHSEETDHFNEKLPPSPTATKRIERTISGTHVPRNNVKATGEDVVTGVGMVPITRKISQPPLVGLFGGVAPSGPDADEGFRPVRSHEEEEERELARQAKGPDPWSVKFEPGDKENPKNWSVLYRWYLTGIAGLLVLNSTFASSAPSGIIREMLEYFQFSREVAILTISLFVAGYCVGPLLWGPLSESYGRRPMFIISFVCYMGFQVGCALSKNTASILIFRFLGGCFAAAPLTNSGALLADIWDTDHRGQAMSIFSLAPFAGPSIGPIVSGFISVTGTSWRWVYWILTIFSGVCLAIIVFTVPETYTPKLLVTKAKKMRKETGDDRWYAPLEKSDSSFKTRIKSIVLKPFIMLVQEPMLMAVTLYMSFVYGVVYLLFEAYPFVFEEVHGFNAGENGLAFLGFFCGGLLCVILFMTIVEPRYLRHVEKLAPEMPAPEERLQLCMFSAWCIVIAMFWFGWTGAYKSIHWISPVIAGGVLGIGVLGMFVSCFNYLVDVYLWAAATALAATTVFRSAFGAGFPLFAVQMYDKLGVQWASSLLGFIALILAPIPIVLTIFGPKLRSMSKYSPNKA